jgi:hypothetical protein
MLPFDASCSSLAASQQLSLERGRFGPVAWHRATRFSLRGNGHDADPTFGWPVSLGVRKFSQNLSSRSREEVRASGLSGRCRPRDAQVRRPSAVREGITHESGDLLVRNGASFGRACGPTELRGGKGCTARTGAGGSSTTCSPARERARSDARSSEARGPECPARRAVPGPRRPERGSSFARDSRAIRRRANEARRRFVTLRPPLT